MPDDTGKKPLRSSHWFGHADRDGFVHRSWMKNQGLPHHLFDGRPVIGICNTWSELTPCNAHFRKIAEHVAAAEIEDGAGRRSLPVPGIGRLPFLAIDAGRFAADHVARGVESVDCHVEQKHMAHLLAKAAEMRRDEEIGMDAGRLADGA